ncbi:MAG TPA: hypothetical protein VFA20_10640 [Myxococcaceae bacterium]|nr:hypothetical protein [Myxococcaceae bacterium]
MHALLLAVLLGAEPTGFHPELHPILQVAGGLEGELPWAATYRVPRLTTQMVSRFGLRAALADWIDAESEFEANAGYHGASTWEGQAALSVRNQLIRFRGARWKVEVGRVTDEASVDYFSQHVADFLIADPFTRDPFLYTGYNRGNGVLGTFDVTPSLRLGFTANAGNPVSLTGSLPIGGAFTPFERFYIQPYQAVNQVANHYPDDTFQMYLLAPSVVWSAGPVEVKAEVQGYQVDTNTTNAFDWFIYGFNARASGRVKLLDGKLQGFANLAFDRNDVVDPATQRLLPDKYVSFCSGVGLDFNYAGANGVGAQYVRIQYRTGGGVITTLQYANLGTTYWLTPQVSLGARLAFSLRHEINSGVPDIGDVALFATTRALVF